MKETSEALKEYKRKCCYLGVTITLALTATVFLIFIVFKFNVISTGLQFLMGILSPFVGGAVLAYLETPLCNRLEAFFTKHMSPKRQGLAASLSVVLCVICTILVVVILIGLIVPGTISSIKEITTTLPSYVDKSIAWINTQLSDYPEAEAYLNSAYQAVYDKVESFLESDLLPQVQTLARSLGTGITNVVSWLVNVVIGFVSSIYMLTERRTLASQGKQILRAIFKPSQADLLLEEISFANSAFSGYIRGKALDSVIVGLISFIVLRILGFENVLLMAVIIAVTNMLPLFGPIIGAIPCLLLILAVNPRECIPFVIYVIIIQQVDGNIIGPKCMGETTHLSALWIVFAIIFFGGLFGFIGMLIGVPLFAVIYDIIKKIVKHRVALHYPKLDDESCDPPEQLRLLPEEEHGATE